MALSSVGGTLSAALGFSFLSIFELFVLAGLFAKALMK